jgi:hypothetical protein
MPKLAPVGNQIDRDANSYTVSGVGSWPLNYQSLADVNRIVDGSPYLFLDADHFQATFQYATPGSLGQFGQLNHVATVKVLSGSVPAWVALIIRDAVTGQHQVGRWWKVPADGVYRDLVEVWLTNPFSTLPWDRDAIGSERFRFGIARLPQYGPARVTRMYVEPV